MTEKERLTVVCLSSQPWQDGMWTNKQHIMSRLAREHVVYYVSFGPKPLPALLKNKARHGGLPWSPVAALRDPVVYDASGVTVLEFHSPRAFVRGKPASHPRSIHANFDLRRKLLARYLARRGGRRDPAYARRLRLRRRIHGISHVQARSRVARRA